MLKTKMMLNANTKIKMWKKMKKKIKKNKNKN
jgi:hypothetical protein